MSDRPKRVLVVDDDDGIRDTVEMVLSDEGYEVLTASDGAAALELAGRLPPDLILLDMKMPIMGGSEFAAAYRKRPGKRAAIVVMTAMGDARGWAAQVSAEDHLGKPFEIDDLLGVVQRCTS